MSYQFTLSKNNPVKQIIKNFGKLPRIPNYVLEDKKIGEWELTVFDCGLAHGYWSHVSNQSEANGGKNIALRKNGEVVMSVTPMELESHQTPLNAANGNVVIAGLGLAMITINLLAKKSVTKLTVLEIDREVIELYPNLLAGKDRELWNNSIESGRLQLIQQDCTETIPDEIIKKIGKIDYAWVDIWNTVGCDTSLPITQHLQKQLNAKQIDFWAMEIYALGELVSKPLFKANPLKAFRQWMESTGLPLSAQNFNTHKQKLTIDLMLIAGSIGIKNNSSITNK